MNKLLLILIPLVVITLPVTGCREESVTTTIPETSEPILSVTIITPTTTVPTSQVFSETVETPDEWRAGTFDPCQSPVGEKMVEKYQPLFGLHGHIHESGGAAKVGRTVCLNPGSKYSEGTLRGALVNIANGKLLSHQFVSG